MCPDSAPYCHGGAVTSNEQRAPLRQEPQTGSATSSTAQVAGALARESMRRPWYTHVFSYAVSVLLMVPAVWLCDWILPGFHVDEPGGPVVFAAVMALVGVVVQPLLVGAAVRLGWLGVALLAFVGQAAVVLITACHPAQRHRRRLLDGVRRGHRGGPGQHRAWVVRQRGHVAGAGQPPGLLSPSTADQARRPGRRGRGLRPDRRRPVPGAADGDHGRHGADADPVGAVGHAPPARVDPQAAGHDARRARWASCTA